MFDAYLNNCHCHQVFLGLSHNGDYARLLGEQLGDVQALDRITLIEGIPYEKELADLKGAFKTTTFEALFRTSKVHQHQQAWSIPQTPIQPAPVPQRTPGTPSNLHIPVNSLSRVSSNATTGTTSSATNTPASTTTPLTTWAAMTAAPFVPSVPQVKSPATPTSATVRASIPGVDRNRLGQRIDKLDTTIPNDDIRRVKRLKLCNVYYLQDGGCHSERCTHDHSYKLGKHDRKCLEMVSKMTPCYVCTSVWTALHQP